MPKNEPEAVGGGLCYFLVCFNSLEYVSFLIAALYRPADLFVIHCDKKAPRNLKQYVGRLVSSLPNVVALESQDYSWAGYSHVRLTLQAIERAAASGASWKHLIVLSEQHLPLKDPAYIEAFLSDKKTVVATVPFSNLSDVGKEDLRNRFSAYYRELPGVGSFAVNLRVQGDAFYDELRHGSNWLILGREHCNYLLEAAQIGKFDDFGHSVHSEENAIQTVLAPLKGEISDFDAVLVAMPHLTDNDSLVASNDLIHSSFESNYLFIRKRPDVLSGSVLETVRQQHFREDIYNLSKVTALPSSEEDGHCALAAYAVRSLVTNALPASAEVTQIDPKHGFTPRIHFVVRTPEMSPTISVRILSENLVDFKVTIVDARPYSGHFALPYVSGEFLVSTIRAKIYDMAFFQEITPLEIESRGFITVRNCAAIQSLSNAAVAYVAKAESIKLPV